MEEAFFARPPHKNTTTTMQKEEADVNYTLADELWENFRVLTPSHCFKEQRKNQYVCILQKKEFVIELTSNSDYETICCRTKQLKNEYKLVAVTINHSYSNFICPVPIELYNGKDSLPYKKVEMQGKDYHDIVFPSVSNEKKVLFHPVTEATETSKQEPYFRWDTLAIKTKLPSDQDEAKVCMLRIQVYYHE